MIYILSVFIIHWKEGSGTKEQGQVTREEALDGSLGSRPSTWYWWGGVVNETRGRYGGVIAGRAGHGRHIIWGSQAWGQGLGERGDLILSYPSSCLRSLPLSHKLVIGFLLRPQHFPATTINIMFAPALTKKATALLSVASLNGILFSKHILRTFLFAVPGSQRDSPRDSADKMTLGTTEMGRCWNE